MRAAVYRRYGPPEVVHLEEIDRPKPAAGELLVRVVNTTVTAADWRFRSAQPWLVQLMNGLARPTRSRVLGTELAGVVEEVGPGVTRYKPGDWVYGDVALDGMGAHAEYACVAEDGKIAATPPSVSHEQAAAVCFGGLAALHFLRDVARLRPGERVLVNGAAGGVGTMAVQVAKLLGAHVTGVSSAESAGLVRSLGADETIDYTTRDPLAGTFGPDGVKYDVVLDTVGNLPVSGCVEALTPGGRCVPVCYGPGPMVRGVVSRLTGGKPVLCGVAKGTRDDVELLGQWLDQGKLRVAVGRHYPLDQIAEAHRYAESGHKHGAVVIDVAPG